MRVTLESTNLTHKKVYGSQHIEVSCNAHIESEKGSHGKYTIRFYRDPISGQVRSVETEGLYDDGITSVTKENILTKNEVEDIVNEYLENL